MYTPSILVVKNPFGGTPGTESVTIEAVTGIVLPLAEIDEIKPSNTVNEENWPLKSITLKSGYPNVLIKSIIISPVGGFVSAEPVLILKVT